MPVTRSDQMYTPTGYKILQPADLPHNHTKVYQVPDPTRPWQIAAPRLTEQWLRKSYMNHMFGCNTCRIVEVYGAEGSSCGTFSFPCAEGIIGVLEKYVGFFTSFRNNQIRLLAPFFGLMLSIAWISPLLSFCRDVVWNVCAYMPFALAAMFGCLVTVITQQVCKHVKGAAPVLALVHAFPPLLEGAEGPDVQTDQNGRACCVCCWDAPPNVLLQPCNHLCLCSACSQQLRETQPEDLCPVCRGRVSLHKRVFV